MLALGQDRGVREMAGRPERGRWRRAQWKVLLVGRQWEAVLCRVHRVESQAVLHAKMGCC